MDLDDIEYKSTDDIEYKSTNISGILINNFKTTHGKPDHHKIAELLIPCIQSLIIEPRFELIARLDVLCSRIADNEPELKEQVEKFKAEAEDFIKGPNNKHFTKNYWNINNKKIPPRILEMFREEIGDTLSNYTKKYLLKENPENLNMEIQNIKDFYIKKYFLNKPTLIKQTTMSSTQKQKKDIEEQQKMRSEEEYSKVFKTAWNDRPSFKEKTIIEDTHGKEHKQLTNMQKYLDLKFINAIDPTKKEDSERFERIFNEFTRETKTKLSEETKRNILELWHGDIYSSTTDESSIMGILEKMLKNKISMRNEVAKIIIQVYILCLLMNKDIYTIFSIANAINNKIKPSDVYNKNIPSAKIQKILSPVIDNITLSEDFLAIRKNWDQILYPEINIQNILNFIDNSKLLSETKNKIKKDIKLLNETKMSKDKLVKQISQIIDKYTSKSLITLNEIGNLLEYN